MPCSTGWNQQEMVHFLGLTQTTIMFSYIDIVGNQQSASNVIVNVWKNMNKNQSTSDANCWFPTLHCVFIVFHLFFYSFSDSTEGVFAFVLCDQNINQYEVHTNNT